MVFMSELLNNLMPMLLIFLLFFAVIIFCFVDYQLYCYLRDKKIVSDYWDFNSYIYGRNNSKKYKIIWDKQLNTHPHLRKAKVFLILYWGLMVMILVILFIIIALGG